MNLKRKADLQRRLSLASVPRPPADLADRIKSDIPEYLRPDADRKRLSRSVSFNMRVAASILIVISSVVAAIYLLAPEDAMIQMVPASPVTVAENKGSARLDQVEVEIAQQVAPEQSVVRLADAAAAAPESPARDRVAEPVVAPSEADIAGESVAVGAVGGRVENSVVAATVAEAAPVAPPAVSPERAPVAAAPQAIAATSDATRFEERAVAKTMASPSLAREAYAADLDLGPRSTVFGITIDPAVFHRIKETLERNQRPSARDVNVEAIINYFAGPPVKPPRVGVKFEVEGSSSPVGGPGRSGYLRFTLDTPMAASSLPVASNAKIEIELNGKVVERATPVGDFTTTAPESALLNNLSVTGLYEVMLKPDARLSDRVATVRLSYTSVPGGKRRVTQQEVYVRDFAKVWTRATRRHRVASLGAVWAESLKLTSPPAPDVAKRAEELATQNPDDELAQELATAATASSRLATVNGF